jgi:cytochrome bd-type quinol oxidase subunit 1
MKLEKWALVAEIASAVAIVITLLFFVVELRSNTEAIRGQNRQAVADGVRQITLAVATNPGLADLVSGDVPMANATESQRNQLATWESAWLKSAEEAYLQYEAGILDEEIWLTRQNQAVSLLSRPWIRGIYEGIKDENLVAAFAYAMDQAIAEREKAQ